MGNRSSGALRAPRILLYSHDTYGLGHIRRTLAVARQLSEDLPQASFLLLTGSTVAHSFALPDRLDFINLPAISKRSNGEYHARSLCLPFREILALREAMIFEATRHFAPDVVLVDKAAAGMKGEMRRSLNYLRAERPGVKLVFGMRDIEDDPAIVREEWRSEGVYRLLEEVYEHIVLYGSRAVYDPVREYGLSPRVAAKILTCGYIRRAEPLRAREQVRRELQMRTGRLVAVTAGGGGDGFQLLSTYLQMLRELPGAAPFDSFIVTGPLLSAEKLRLLRQFRLEDRAARLVEFTPQLLDYLQAADAVVSMGGYNSMCELLSLGQRAIIVPRVKPRIEQLIRAERFAALGLLRMIHPDELTPARLHRELLAVLEGERPPAPETVGVEMDGVRNASRAIQQWLSREEAVACEHKQYA